MKYKYAFVGIIVIVALMASSYVLTTGKTVTADATAIVKKDIKDFYIDSFYTIENGKPHPQYSLKEIKVNKGDIVRIHVNTTKGTHDFNIDELNVHSETPTGQVTVIEFTADTTGNFVYYCSMPGHRQNGHWGALRVVE